MKMLDTNTLIFASYHKGDADRVKPALERLRSVGWRNIFDGASQDVLQTSLETIQKSGMVLLFLSKSYLQEDRLMLEEFAYAATVVRKPFIPVWLDTLADTQQDYLGKENDSQLLSALEMLTAKNSGTTIDELAAALERFEPDAAPYTPSSPQICDKPCEAYEGDEPYLFISYAHDDAEMVYPIIKALYESGMDLWYDEGIKITERYLPVIADHVRRCSVFVLMLTKRCLDRPFVMNYELEYAHKRGFPIVPVLLEELSPKSLSSENIQRLVRGAIAPDALRERLTAFALPDRGTRTAVPPAIKQNVVYDVSTPPELPGFKIAVENGEITIVRYTGSDRDVVIPSTVESADGSMAVRITAIGEYAFSAGGLSTRFLAGSEIRNEFKNNKKSFKNCKSLRSVTISEGITKIGNHAFFKCKRLDRVIIPEGVTDIGDNAFCECKSLKSITLPSSLKNIGSASFSGCMKLRTCNIPDGITNINKDTFAICKSLESITIPDSVTSIGEGAFSVCFSLKNIVIPDSVTSIGDHAFAFCRSLETAVLPEIKDRGSDIFSYCSKLDGILNTDKNGLFNSDKTILLRGPRNWKPGTPYRIPEGVTKINRGAFTATFGGQLRFLTRLFFKERPPESVIIPRSVTEISDGAFYRAGLKTISIPDSVTRIGKSAFSECFILESVIIPDSVTSIGDSAFSSCRSLKSITIPDSVTSIGEEAFMECRLLKTITIPDSVTDIGSLAFYHTPGESTIRRPRRTSVTEEETQEEETQEEVLRNEIVLPQCSETPRAYICCAEADIEPLYELLAELYWEGFNLYYNEEMAEEEIGQSACVLVFFSQNTEKSEPVMDKIKYAVQKDESRIIQVFTGNCTDWPDAVKNKLHDRQAIVQSLLSEQEFSGKMRESLRHFDCTIGHPRGFTLKQLDGSVEVTKFTSTGFPHVVIPKTFLNPPLPVSSIGPEAFRSCEDITSVVIPDGVTRIAGEDFLRGGAFSGCSSLRTITIPDSVKDIGPSVFSNCENLISLDIPTGVESIGDNAFWPCEKLTIYTPPNGKAWEYAEKNNIKHEPLPLDHSENNEQTTTHETAETADSYSETGSVYAKLGYCKQALECYTRALTVRQNIHGAEHTSIAVSYGNIAYMYKRLGKYGEALEYCQKAIALEQAEPDIADRNSYIQVYCVLGGIYSASKDYPVSMDNYRKALSYITDEVVFAEEPQQYLEDAFQDIQNICALLPEDEKAKQLHDDVSALKQKYSSASHVRCGLAFYDEDEYDKAIAEYTEALNLYPNNAAAYCNRGESYRMKKQYDEAIQDLEKAISLDQNYQWAKDNLKGIYYDRGLAYKKQGDYDKAIAEYTGALKLDPNYAKAYNNRGNAYDKKGEYDKALTDYTEAIRLNPDNAFYYRNRGNTYMRKGGYDQAIADYTEALRLDPDNDKAKANLAKAQQAKAAEHAKSPSDSDSMANLSVLFNRGIDYASKGDYDHAIAEFTEVIRLKPDFAKAYLDRGNAYYNKKDYDKAIADYNALLRFNPNDISAYGNRGLAHVKKEDYDQAIADFTEIIRLKPDFAKAYLERSNAYLNKGNYDKAISDYNELLRLNPNDVNTHGKRGLAYVKKEDYDLAIADFTEAIRLKPDFARAYLDRGNAHEKKGDYDLAIADYTEALRLDPDNDKAKANLAKAQQAQDAQPT
jgi:tetratricopeptide (TPR) repeat protein